MQRLSNLLILSQKFGRDLEANSQTYTLENDPKFMSNFPKCPLLKLKLNRRLIL